MADLDRDRAIEEALAGRAPQSHPDLDQVAAFAARLRARAGAPVRSIPFLPLADEPDYASAGRARRRGVPYGWAAAAAAAVLAITGVAAAHPWVHHTTAAAASSSAPPEPSTSASPVATTLSSKPEKEPVVVRPIESTSVTATTVVAERPTNPPPVTPKTEPTVAPPPPVLPAGVVQARAAWEICAARDRTAGLAIDRITSDCGPEPNLTAYQAALGKWQVCQRIPKPAAVAPVCGPAPDPRSFGFVSPWWAGP